MGGEKKMKIHYVKVKAGKMTKIKKPKSIEALQKKGFAVSKITETKGKTKIETHSALTRLQNFKARQKQGFFS